MPPSTDNEQSLDLSIVIPLFNERENIVPLIDELENYLPKWQWSFEVVLIDDGSTDGSPRLIQELQEDRSWLRLIRFEENDGQTSGFVAGFQEARGDIIVTMDADLQNSPADIPDLLAQLDDYDMACGWRHKRNDPWIKKISSKIANAVRNRLSDETISDTGCSLKAFRRGVFDDVKFYKGLHRFFPTLAKMAGYRVVEVKVSHRPRLGGHSKYNIRNRVFASFYDLLAIRWMKKRALKYKVKKES